MQKGFKKGLYCLLIWGLLAVPVLADQSESEPNDILTYAKGPINFPENLTGGLPGPGSYDSSPPTDYWWFNGEAGKTYRFLGVPIGSCGLFTQRIDIDFEVRTQSDVKVGEQYSAGDCAVEDFQWTAPSTERFYLRVWDMINASTQQTYRIECSILQPADTPTPTPTATPSVTPTPTRTPRPVTAVKDYEVYR